MEKYSSKRYANKIRIFFVFTWITKVSTLLLFCPGKYHNTFADLGNGMGYGLMIFVFFIIILPLELASFGCIDYCCCKYLKIILFIFDLIPFLSPFISYTKLYFPFTLYLISASLYFLFNIVLIYFIICDICESKNNENKKEENDASEMLTIDNNK